MATSPDIPILHVRRLDPEADAPMVHAWVTQPRGRFWGMAQASVAQVRDIYAFVDSLETHHAWIAEADGRPVALLQTYAPEQDPVAEAYEVAPGDLGVHVFTAPNHEPDSVRRLGVAIVDWLFSDPAVQRLVGEPDAGNRAVLARLRALGFQLGQRVRIGEKEAQLVFLDRVV